MGYVSAWMSNARDHLDHRQRVGRGAIGVIERAGRYLMIQRAAGLVRAGYWCLSGGHVEPGETSRDAVIRELAEEPGLVVEPVQRLGSLRVHTSRRYILAVWRVRVVSGEMVINQKEIAAVAWLDGDEIRRLSPALASNLDVLKLLGA